MARRERELRRQVRLTNEEWDMIQTKMQQYNTTNFSAYARKMLIDGYVIHRDFRELKDLVKELGAIGRNINQIAKVANETRNISTDAVKALQMEFYYMRAKINERLVKIINEE